MQMVVAGVVAGVVSGDRGDANMCVFLANARLAGSATALTTVVAPDLAVRGVGINLAQPICYREANRSVCRRT